jgi:hypothetical protein
LPVRTQDELLPRADFVILTVPHTPVTEGFFDRARFQRMKPTAFFINIGRGMTTKLDDLVTALEAGEIAGAALDVYEQEPLPSDHRLWTLPNVLLTPHMAGHGPYLNDRRFQIIVDNCRAFRGRTCIAQYRGQVILVLSRGIFGRKLHNSEYLQNRPASRNAMRKDDVLVELAVIKKDLPHWTDEVIEHGCSCSPIEARTRLASARAVGKPRLETHSPPTPTRARAACLPA